MICVAVVDNAQTTPEAMTAFFKDHPELHLTGRFGGGQTFLTALQQQPLLVDVVLLEIGLPDIGGIEVAQAVKALDLNIQVIMLTDHEDEAEVLAALQSGAHAYCLKSTPKDRLAEIIKAVYEGGFWLDPKVAQVAAKVFEDHNHSVGPDEEPPSDPIMAHVSPLAQAQATDELNRLTAKEKVVLARLVEGKSNSEIAHELGISIHTIKAHISHILEKLAVYDRVQAAVKAVKYNLVTFQ